MTKVVVSQPMYFPWVGFLAQVSLADVMIWLDDAQFSRGFFNRVQIPSGQTTKWMTVPLAKGGSRQPINETAYVDGTWRTLHRNSLLRAYSGATFCDDVLSCFDCLETENGPSNMIISSSECLARATGVQLPDIRKSSQLKVSGRGSDWMLNLVRAVGGSTYITGHGARNYLDHAAFEAAGVAVDYMDYAPRPWPQSSASFTPYVTGLDLVAHVPAPDRRGHLNPRTTPWREVVEQD